MRFNRILSSVPHKWGQLLKRLILRIRSGPELGDKISTVNSKASQAGKCIYTQPEGLCEGSKPLHPKEHYLPAGLGNFRNDVRLRDYICAGCQEKFSKFEDVFMHHGPEAFFRHMIGVSGRKRSRKKNIFYEPTAGMAPLTVIAQMPGEDYTALWQIEGVSKGSLMKQLIFQDEQNTDIHLALRPGKLAKDFARLRKMHKGKRLWLIATICNPEEEAEIDSVCAEFLKGTRSDPQMLPEGDSIEGQMRAAISIPYLQAIAKIAFHYVLAHFPFTGLEPQFDDIKRFIYTGADHGRFVQWGEEPFIEQLKDPRAVSTHWCHLLSAQYDAETVESRMQFFSGPQVRPLVWRVMLGASPARVVGTCAKGFSYRYSDQPNKDGYVGEMTPLALAKP
jgi:hypothetical protein